MHGSIKSFHKIKSLKKYLPLSHGAIFKTAKSTVIISYTIIANAENNNKFSQKI